MLLLNAIIRVYNAENWSRNTSIGSCMLCSSGGWLFFFFRIFGKRKFRNVLLFDAFSEHGHEGYASVWIIRVSSNAVEQCEGFFAACRLLRAGTLWHLKKSQNLKCESRKWLINVGSKSMPCDWSTRIAFKGKGWPRRVWMSETWISPQLTPVVAPGIAAENFDYKTCLDSSLSEDSVLRCLMQTLSSLLHQ